MIISASILEIPAEGGGGVVSSFSVYSGFPSGFPSGFFWWMVASTVASKLMQYRDDLTT